MSETMARIDKEDTEVELSTQDLLALSDAVPVDEPDTGPALQPSKPTAIVSTHKPDAPQAATNQASRLPLAIIVIVSIAGVTHVLKPGGPTDQSQTSKQTSTPGQDEPVRFANPFDAAEVFEFPPGTTEAEARDAVAAVLKERAMSRQNPT